MFIDTHCHLSSCDYENIEEVLKENRKEHVSPIIISGCSKKDINESLEYARKYGDVFVTIGYHPSEARIVTDSDLDNLKRLLVSSSKVIGVGEIGLDYYYGKDDKEKQLTLFEKQLKIAEELDLPVVIHSREATLDTITLLKKYKVVGVIHCFSGSLETANEYIKMGFLLGIGGVVTFKNSNLGDVLSKIPLQKLVLETDSPYLTPEPFRGTKNTSKYIHLIAKKVAECKSVSILDVEKITSINASKVFQLDVVEKK